MFPTDPNSPGGPDRSEYARRGHTGRIRHRLRLLSLKPSHQVGASGWPPVRQLRPLGSTPARERNRSAA